MESKPFTAKGTSDLLGTVPALFGFHPENSLIAIATNGPRNRLGFRLRLDMPDTCHVNEAAEIITHHLLAQNTEGAILIALTDHKDEADTLVNRITELLGQIPVHEAVRADGTYYWSYLAEAREQGTLYADPSIAPVVVEAIGAGMPIYGSRAELAARYNTEGPSTLEKVREVIDTLAQEVGTPDSVDRVSVSAQVLHNLDTVMADRGALNPERVAWLAIGASLTQIRDEMWARMTRTNADSYAEIWRLVAKSVADEASVGPYTLCAFAHWLHGDGAQAIIALERAHAIAPNYSMANLIGTMLENGLNPETWDGFDPADPA